MDIVKLGKRDKATSEDSIFLRPGGIYPIERYSESRLKEFFHEDSLTPAEAKRAKKKLKSRSR